MRKLACGFALTLLFGMSVNAQEPTLKVREMERNISLGELTPTPEMWFYEQEQREYNNPRNGVRRKAEYRSAQRQRRLAAQKWFGYSNLRPTVSPTPFYGTYSPHWSSNGHDPSQWRGTSAATVVLQPQIVTPGLR
jgi:hypothetical protein